MTAGLEEARAMLDRGVPADEVRRKVREALGAPEGGPGAMRGRRLGAEPRGDGVERPIDGPRWERGDWPGLFGPNAGGAPPGGPLGPDRPEAAVLDGQRVEEMMRFVEKNRPEMARRLRELREQDPEALRVFLRDKGRQIARMMREESERPELWRARRALGDAERRAFEAAEEARRADGPGRAAAEDRLRSALGAQFEARVALARLEIAAAKSRVERLSDQLEESIAKRDAFLDERFQKAMASEELVKPPLPPPLPPDAGPGPRPGERRPSR